MAKNLINSNDIEVETLGSNLKLELSEEVHEQLDALDDYVVDSMAGNEQNKAPSVRSVKDYVKDIYSTDEVKTNKIWTDGKPIYRKVYTGTIPSGTSQYTVGTITNFGESTGCFLKVYSSNGVEWIGYLTSSVSSGLQISPSGEMKIYETVTDTAPFKLVIEYTKTTD